MRNILLILFSFVLSIGIYAQNRTYQFSHISTADGLSQSSAIAIHQDNLGQIWMGTRDGLNKYDGSKITVYRNEIDNPRSISNNDILSITEDKDGYIWVGTFNGLNKYDPQKDTFTNYFFLENKNSISNNNIKTIQELADGKIWIGTTSGLSIYDKEKDVFIIVNKENSNLVGNHVKTIYQSKSGIVYIGTSTGISQLVKQQNNNFQFKTISGSEGLNIQQIIKGYDNTLLIATNKNSVLEYDINNKKIAPYFTPETLKNKNKNVRQLLIDDNGLLWIGTYNGLQIANKNKEITVLTNSINDPKSLSINSIKSLFKDKKGSIWVGTYYGGINIWDTSNVNFVNYSQNTGDTSLSYNVVSSFEKYKNLIFIGTEGGGVTVLNNDDFSISYINKKKNPELNHNSIKSLFLHKNKYLWMGIFEKGVSIYNVTTNQFNNSILSEELKTYLDGVGVYSIKEDNNGFVWLGTFGNGVVKYNVKEKTFEKFTVNSQPYSLSNNLVRSMTIDSKNNIWAGTEKGLNMIDNQGKIKNYFIENEDDISTVFEDSKGTIWVGTKVNGFFKFNGLSFDKIELKIDNKPVSTIRSIVEDKKGKLWMGSNLGIINYNDKTKEHILYTQKEGIISNEFNDNAALIVDGSKLYFGSPAGVTYFDSNNLIKNNHSPQVLITDFKIKNKSVSIEDENQLLSKTIQYTKDLELSYKQGNFNISFAIPNFINSNGNHYKYRLSGLENDWVETSSNSTTYTIQTPGTYTFEVKGANSDGIWNKTATQLKIKVNPAPWRSSWAFLLYATLIGLSLWGLLWIMKSKAILKHELKLEHLERERTKEVNLAKLKFFTNISHEFRTPLALITGPLQQIIDGYSGSNAMYKKLLVIESSANHLLRLINRLMDFRKLESNQFNLETTESNFVKFLHEIFLSFSEFAKNGNYNYNFNVSHQEIAVYYDQYKLERVFYNLISNAFRYTPEGGDILINVKKQNNSVIIEIEDSGVGISPENVDKIFDRFFEVAIHNNPEKNYNKGTGIGLSIAHNIIKLHHGTICVNNKKEKGAIFKVELPLGKDHLSENEIVTICNTDNEIAQYEKQRNAELLDLDKDLNDLVLEKKKYTILIVEDNTPLRTFINDLLKTKYNIIEAENGKIALKKVKEHLPDLVISDVVMPEMVGTDLCSAIKKDLKTSHIPVILLTSRSSLIFKFEGLESGADDYISKPFNLKEFRLRIKNLLDSKQRLQDKFSKDHTFTPSDIAISSIDEELLKKAFAIVEKNIENDHFDIPLFCSELGVSRSLLFTKIKAWTNFTPNEFIHEIRLKRAAQLLEQNKISVSQVCYKVGFRTPKYFSKCFQKKYGLTPTQYLDKFSDDIVI